jgi:filamentous hemagglutinin
MVAGNDINLVGKTVNIANDFDTYDFKSKYEFKQSGISVSLGGKIGEAAGILSSNLNRAGEVSDDRLKALYAYKAYDETQKVFDSGKGAEKAKDGSKSNNLWGVNVSVGSSKFTSTQTVHAETVNPANILADGDVNIRSKEGNINLVSTIIEAKDVNLDAAQDVNLLAAQNRQEINGSSSGSSWAVGASISGGAVNPTGSFSKNKGSEKGTTITNSGTVINAQDEVNITSGNDANISGSKVIGGKVAADIGGDLNIESLQDSDVYSSNSKGTGISFGQNTTDDKKTAASIQGSITQSKINSNYQSVTDQAGIYAGEEGLDIYVGGNTDLTGAAISSEADKEKNKLSTDTLTYGDIQNKAEYSSSGAIGFGIGYGNVEEKDKGLPPIVGIGAKGSADSTTEAAISEGTLEIRSNPDQDLSGLSRDTANSLNALGKIFDKKKVEERQELAALFGEEMFKAIGDLGLKEGSPAKAAVDAVAGGIMAKLGGGDFASGAASAAINQLVMHELRKIDDPAVMQWVSVALGAAVAKIIGGDAQTGASVAASETKNNALIHVITAREEVLAGVEKGLEEEFGDLKELFTAIKNAPRDTVQEMLLGTTELLTSIAANPAEYGREIAKEAGTYLSVMTFDGTAEETGIALGKTIVFLVSLPVGGAAAQTFKNYPKLAKLLDLINSNKIVSKVVRAPDNPWPLGNFDRGWYIDKLLGNNLGRYFPVVDKLENGVLTSIKSIDVTAKSYQTQSGLYSTIRTQINALDKFTGDSYNKVDVTPDMYSSKVLQVAIPDVKLSVEQTSALKNAQVYAQQKGIKVEVVVVK